MTALRPGQTPPPVRTPIRLGIGAILLHETSTCRALPGTSIRPRVRRPVESRHGRRDAPAGLSTADAEGGSRTHTGREPHRILSPARLPVPPLRRERRVAPFGRRQDLQARQDRALAEPYLGSWARRRGRTGETRFPPCSSHGA